MSRAAQGDVLRVAGIAHPMLVVSNDFFNASDRVVAVPLLKSAADSPLHILLKAGQAEGFVLCEQLKYLDLSVRRYAKLGEIHYYEIMDIADAIMGMFDYQQI